MNRRISPVFFFNGKLFVFFLNICFYIQVPCGQNEWTNKTRFDSELCLCNYEQDVECLESCPVTSPPPTIQPGNIHKFEYRQLLLHVKYYIILKDMGIL